jgi:hypothetical protein
MKYPKLYAWTTDTYSKCNWIKIGETINQSVDARISQTDSTGMAEPPVKLWEYDATNISKKLGIYKNFDKYLHKLLKTRGYNQIRGNREFFEIRLDDLKSIINDIEYGSCRPNSFKPRQEQLDAIEFTRKVFETSDECLWNAKMRFGKTLTTYWLCKNMNFKKILILTYKTSVEDSWREDLLSHVDFENSDYIYVKDDLKESSDKLKNINDDRMTIIFGSFQDGTGKDLSTSQLKRKWKDILNIDFDLIVFDEVHYGTSTKNASQFINKLSFKKKLLLSGTPIKLLMSGKYDDTNTYKWSYIDEQKKRNIEKQNNWKTEVYRWLPVMNMFTYEIGESVYKHVDYYTDEEGLTLSKFFGSEDGITLKNSKAVETWLDLLSVEDIRIYNSPFNNDMFTGKMNHMVWKLSNVKSIKALRKLLENHHFFRKYKIITAADDNDGEGSNTLQLVKDCIKKHPMTITLTCGKLGTGNSIPDWVSCFMLDDCSSPESYWQMVFRCQTPNKKDRKDECYVFDFNPNRSLSMIYEYSEKISNKNKSTSSTIRELLDVMKVFSYKDNTLNLIKQDDFQLIIENSINPEKSISKFINPSIVNLDVKIDNTAFDIINSITGKGTLSHSTELSNSDLVKGKNSISTKKKSNNKIAKSQIKVIVDKITHITKMIPTHMFISTTKIECVDDIFNTTVNFEDIYSISVKDFKYLVDKNYIRVNIVNKAIESFNYINNVS